MAVIVETSIGDFTIDLMLKERPKACFNFLKLCKMKYYNYSLIFEVKKDYAARAGDPTNTGQGGHSIYWRDRNQKKKYFRAEKLPIIRHTEAGLVSMINNGQDRHGSQFLITLSDNLNYLDEQGHTVFGRIVEGFDIIKALNETLVDDKDQPYRDICISHTVVLEDPFSDPSYVNGRRSPDIPDYLVDSERVGLYDDLNSRNDKTDAELAAQDAYEKAILLEMLGDLPNADAKPPENVLFICKLNPITEEEDLQRIFSRFGKINSVYIVKDSKSGQSLQYGFIEYDRKEDCETAYLKMDNVLLDDRRIHVDFSQSVVKNHKLYNKKI